MQLVRSKQRERQRMRDGEWDNGACKIKADSVLLLSLLAERTCSQATPGASSRQGQTERKCVCVCVHQSNHYDCLLPNTPICQDKRVTQQARRELQPKKEEKKQHKTQCTLLPGSGKMSFVNKWAIYFPSHQWTHGT